MYTLDFIIAVIATGFTTAAFFVGVGQLWIALYPTWLEYRSRKILNDNFSSGPYDKATIERSTKYYIRPKCSNIDPSQEEELRHALIATREDLFQKVEHFLNFDQTRRHLLILADSGTGKTSFMLNYYAYNSRKPKGKKQKILIVPLGIKSADNLISSIPNKSDSVIFLDAFDEDVKAIQNHHERIIDLIEKCRDFRKVVITCRTQFFPKDEEIPVETGIVKIAPVGAGEKKSYEFWKIYLSPFDDDDIKKYIKKRYPVWEFQTRKEAEEIALRIPLLSVRPMLLSNIPEVIARNIDIKYTYQLYEIMLDAWLDRESNWTDKKSLRMFSQKLAIDLYANRESRGMERIPQKALVPLALRWSINLNEWQITGRSLLNRDADGNYKFAHRSFMEYMFVLMILLGDNKCYGIELTDQMKFFLGEMLSKSNIRLMGVTQKLFESWKIVIVSSKEESNPEGLLTSIRQGKLVGKSLQFVSTIGSYIYLRNPINSSLYRLPVTAKKDLPNIVQYPDEVMRQVVKILGEKIWNDIGKINALGELVIIPLPPNFNTLAIQLEYLDKLPKESRTQKIQEIITNHQQIRETKR